LSPSSHRTAQLWAETPEEAFLEALDHFLTPSFYEDPAALGPEEATVVRIFEMVREIENGGFDQFFFNATGGAVAETRAAWVEVGSPEALACLEAATAAFPGGRVPKPFARRQALMDRIQAEDESVAGLWEALSERFLAGAEGWRAAVRAYVGARLSRFR